MFLFTVEKDLLDIIAQVEEKFNVELPLNLKYSDFEDFDYQSSILFKISKHEKLTEITNFIVSYLKNTGHYKEIKKTGKGYLSFKIDIDNCFKEDPSHIEGTVIVDYCGINVAKKMHIGHIRSMFIGDYIVKQHQFLGHNVIRFNHIGDWGNQFGYLINYLLNNNIEVTDNEQLTEIYKNAYLQYENDNQFKEDSNNVSILLKEKKEPYFSIWKKCRDISIKDMNNILESFNISLTEKDIIGESFYAPMLEEVEKILLDQGIVTTGEDGSIVYKGEKVNPLMLKKSNGTYLYAMYDIAAIFYRISKYNPNKIIYVVDKRQEQHFKAIFQIAQKLGLDQNCIFEHVGFGFILGQDGTPLKTKKGETMYLDNMIEQGMEELSKNPFYKDFHPEYKDKILKDTLYGSLKWFDLSSNYSTDYKFNWDNILDNNAGTAPYVQHAYARLDSLFFKNNINEHEISHVNDFSIYDLDPIVIDLYKNVMFMQESLYTLGETYSSNLIEEKFLVMIKAFHYFYDNISIAKSEPDMKDKILYVLEKFKITMEDTTEILGIKLYESYPKFLHKEKIKEEQLKSATLQDLISNKDFDLKTIKEKKKKKFLKSFFNIAKTKKKS